MGGAGKYDGIDLAAGHQLFGLALVYDWMFRDLDPHTRDTIHDTLLKRGRRMFQAAIRPPAQRRARRPEPTGAIPTCRITSG